MLIVVLIACVTALPMGIAVYRPVTHSIVVLTIVIAAAISLKL
jgi:hypothetical protein